MVQVTERLERYVADEGCCADESVDACATRLADLDVRSAAERTDDDVAALSALANGTRYRLVRLLHAAEDELCVCELDALVDASESAVSHALRSLRDAGLVTARKEGRWKYYRATARATALVVALDGTRGDR